MQRLDAKRKLSRFELAVLLIVATGSSLLCGMLAVGFDISRLEHGFRGEAKLVQSHIAKQVGSTDAALTALSGLFSASDRVDPDELRIMAHELMSAYSHIYLAGHAWSMGAAEQSWLGAQYLGDGFSNFSIKTLRNDGSLEPATPEEDSYPLRVLEPQRPIASSLMGLDLANSPALREAFQEAVAGRTVAATRPIRLGQLGTGYLAFRAVQGPTPPEAGFPTSHPVGMLVLGLEAGRFFDNLLPPGSDMTMCLHDGAGCGQETGRLYLKTPEPSGKAALPFGGLHYTQSIDFHGRPLTLVLTAPIHLDDIHFGLISVFVGIPLLIGVGLALAWRRQRSARHDSAVSARLLRRNEERFRDFANAASDWFWETDARMRYTYISEPFLDCFGLPLDQVLGRTRDELAGGVAFDDSEGERYRKALQDQSAFRDIVARHTLADGSERWIRSSAVPHYDDHDDFSGWRGVSTDVTDQQHAQMLLQQSEARFRHMLEAAPVPLAVLNNKRFVYSNSLARQLLVGDGGELVGLPSGKFIVEQSARSEALGMLLRDGVLRNFEAKMQRDDGSTFWCEISAVETVFDDQPSHLVGYVDISERKQALEFLKDTNERFRQLTGTIPVPFVVSRVDDGRILFSNELASTQFGLDPDKPKSTTPDWFAALLGAEALEAISSSGIFQDVEMKVSGLDGQVRWIVVSGQRLNYDGQPSVATAFLDITARKQSEAAMRAARDEAERANATKSQFLANMSHELRTPLNAIIGFSELIQTEVHGPLGAPQYGSYAGDIQASGQHLLQIINDILDLSRIEAGKTSLELDEIRFVELAEECLRFVKGDALEERIALSIEDGTAGAMLIADPRQMKQILINLLSNAIKFTPANGRVVVRGMLERDAGLRLEVEDTGIGVAKAHLANILEPFSQVENSYTRRRGGTGLGLPLARSLAELNGGTLSLQSEPGHGTTVSLHFPPDKVRLPQAAYYG